MPSTEASTAREMMLTGLPVRARRLEVAGIDTYLVEGGEGLPLVLMHGGIDSAGAYWTHVIAALAREHRLIIPDAPGLGESAAAPGGQHAADAFDPWFAELIRITCQDGPPAVVAHSLLGTLAARFAARTTVPRLRHLVVWGAPGVGPYRMPPGLILAAIRLSMRPSQRNLERMARWPFHDLDGARAREPEWFDAFFSYTVACARMPRVKRTMRQLISTCSKQLPDAVLRRVTVPTTLLWGRYDRMVPLRVGEYASAAHGWPLRVVETGHVPHVEDPAGFVDTLNSVLAEKR
jgi:pimeloyl-ACP methyl ester carboxylesterase